MRQGQNAQPRLVFLVSPDQWEPGNGDGFAMQGTDPAGLCWRMGCRVADERMGYESKLPPTVADPSAQGGDGVAVDDSSKPRQPARPPTRIGTRLEQVRSRLIDVAGRLEPHLDPHALPIVTEARRVLAEQTCRIAVIGQIKAGKSSFINALMLQPDLLPTDINPWTAVVTSLHCRDDRPLPDTKAVFQLFSREEWQRLAEGGGRLRELTERLVPGFEPELLRAQVEVMRQRVEHRLGDQLENLLGQTHGYQQITPELLERYVSAGTYLGPGQQGQTQQFSDITRSADLYMAGGPFAFPVTLIDTPGTNDPFLVRDEITRRSLEGSDIYVFVISALQPLSANEISLLRILNGLHKDRIIVFINRIDQLRNPLADGAAVRASVRSRLERELPALEIPVVAGSAWWGCMSMAASDRDISRLLPQGSIAYLHECGLPRSIEVAGGQPLPSDQRAKLASALFIGSGIPSIAAAITELLSGGSAAMLLRQLTACFLELTRSTEVAAKLEVQALDSMLETHRNETRAMGDRIRQERIALNHLDEPISQIQQSFLLIERQLGEIVHNGADDLRAGLSSIVETFAAEECAAMMTSIRRQDHDGEWHADLRDLRQSLEAHYVNSYRAIEARLIEIEQVLYPQLKTIVDAIVPGSGIQISENFAAPTNPYPTITTLTETAVLDLEIPWWKAWFAARPDPIERAADLKAIIYDDFMPVAADLADQALARLRGRVGNTLQQAHAVSTGMLTAIQQRKAQVLADYEALNAAGAPGAASSFEAEQAVKVEHAKARHEAVAQLVDELTRLAALCQQALSAEARA